MSVIVKGMEMPESCAKCKLCKHEKWNDENIYQCNAKLITFGEFDTWIFKKRPDWCPLHPLPEKHGRLIDANALVGRFEPKQAYFTEAIINKLGTAPAIVEAEGE